MARGTPEGCLPYDDARWGKREARTCLANGATFCPAREEAEALAPGFVAGEEHPEKHPPEAREEPGCGSHPRWGEQQRETAWDGLHRACSPQGTEEARVVKGSCSDRHDVVRYPLVADGVLWHNEWRRSSALT
jgi:hypothetical protein